MSYVNKSCRKLYTAEDPDASTHVYKVGMKTVTLLQNKSTTGKVAASLQNECRFTAFLFSFFWPVVWQLGISKGPDVAVKCLVLQTWLSSPLLQSRTARTKYFI